jgi:uncharacterized protein (DUF305 family)
VTAHKTLVHNSFKSEQMEQNKTMKQQPMMMSYRKLLMMIVISFIIMYAVMFLNVDNASHIYVSTTRTYMALLMALPMAIVMIAMMSKMYPNKKLNTLIIVGAVISFGIVLAGLRSQTPVGDVQYMKGMIPHHSSAIMVSRHAALKDPEVKKLSEQISGRRKRKLHK